MSVRDSQMPNFLYIVDPDQSRRASFVARARAELAFLPQLEISVSPTARADFLAAVAPGAPLSHHFSDTGALHLLGDALTPDNRLAVDARALASASGPDFDAPATCNGYYVAARYDTLLGHRIEADVLGLFPVYYWWSGEVLLVGSSPACFRHHPLFRWGFDLHAAAALLLTSGLVDGRTLVPGVRRLARDHVLLFRPGEGARELPPPPLPATTAAPEIRDVVAEVHARHSRFIAASLARSRRPGNLLSGGLDSRILAGITAELEIQPHCLTFGRTSDMDAICAAGVARTLDLPLTRLDVDFARYPQHAEASVAWEQLSGGLYSIPIGWNLAHTPRDFEIDRIVCGLTLDAVVGGAKAVASTDSGARFDQLRIGTLGFDTAELEQLIRDPALKAACADIRARVVDNYLRSGVTDHERTWWTNLLHRQRFPVGNCAWRYAAYAWPVLPALDRSLVALMASLPPELTAKRRVQSGLLTTRFPELAALELDRNYFDTRPLIGDRNLIQKITRRATKLSRIVQMHLGRETRFYVRTMDFNSPGWRAIRTSAEPHRQDVAGLFHAAALDRILPAPNRRARRRSDPIIHSTPLKNTVGLLRWFGRYS